VQGNLLKHAIVVLRLAEVAVQQAVAADTLISREQRLKRARVQDGGRALKTASTEAAFFGLGLVVQAQGPKPFAALIRLLIRHQELRYLYHARFPTEHGVHWRANRDVEMPGEIYPGVQCKGARRGGSEAPPMQYPISIPKAAPSQKKGR